MELELSAISDAGVVVCSNDDNESRQRLSLLNRTNLSQEIASVDRTDFRQHVRALAFTRDARQLVVVTDSGIEALSTTTLKTEARVDWNLRASHPEKLAVSAD